MAERERRGHVLERENHPELSLKYIADELVKRQASENNGENGGHTILLELVNITKYFGGLPFLSPLPPK